LELGPNIGWKAILKISSNQIAVGKYDGKIEILI